MAYSPAATSLCLGNIFNQFALGPSLTPVEVATITCAEQSFTVQGLKTTDIVFVTSQVAQTAGVGICGARVSAENTLTVNFCNPTADGVTPAAGQYNVLVTRYEGPSIPTVIS